MITIPEVRNWLRHLHRMHETWASDRWRLTIHHDPHYEGKHRSGLHHAR